MNITNVRLGLATNSSSTHSIVLDPVTPEFGVDTHGKYGWQDFCLRTREAKRTYLSATLYSNLTKDYPARVSEDYGRRICESLFGELPKNYDGSVDHQSLITLPKKFHYPNEVDLEFLRDFTDYIMKDGLAICGGNDNDDDGVSYEGSPDPITERIAKESCGELTCRKDEDNWVLFNRRSGGKIRLSFTSQEPYTRSTFPELIDLKITDACPYEKLCSDCYQGSTVGGVHADLDGLIYRIAEIRPFEIAIGGGEPTFHPNFPEILKEIRKHGMVPNFTTFSVRGWGNKKEISDAVVKYVGGFAVSINDYQGLKKIEEALAWRVMSGYSGEIAVQSILGLCDDYSIMQIIERLAKIRHEGRTDYGIRATLTLLGYKSWGRALGKEPKKVDFQRILAHARKHNVRLGIDTKAVQQYRDVLEKEGVDSILITDREGQFSCYIDAVNKVLARDSYSETGISYDKPGILRTIEANFPFI